MDKIKKWVATVLSVTFIVTIVLVVAVSGKAAERNELEGKNIPNTGYLSDVEITKPKEGYMYIFDREIAPMGITLVLGKITIEVETIENVSGVDIYIDDVLKFSDYTYPYSRVWNEKATGRHVIRAVEHGGNESDEVSLFIFNLIRAKPSVVINEIMSDPEGSDGGKEWIELYNAGESGKIKGWTISNSNGNPIATLPNWVFPNDTYLVINFGNGINDEDFSDGNATFYAGSSQEIFDNIMDECALYTGNPSSNTIIDFVSYCYAGKYEPGVAHDYATKAGIWDEGEYFNPMERPLSYGARLPRIEEGDSIGRDSYSNCTNSPQDWDIGGGRDAYLPSPGQCNYDVFGIINKQTSSQVKMATTKKKEWTVMVYMADCDLERDFWRQLHELEQVGTDDNINIVFQIDGWAETREVYQDVAGAWKTRNHNRAFRGFLLKDNSTGYVDWETDRGRIRYRNDRFVRAFNLPGDQLCIREINTGDDAPLRDFISWAKNRAEAYRYILILGGHGAGWKGLMIDKSNGDDWLYMHELEKALRGTASHLAIVGFDLCMMANIEVAYQIRDWVQYMVASEELDRGWDYKDIFGHLQNNPDISAPDLATYIVNSYHRQQSHWKCHTLSAIDLGRLGAVYGKMRLLSIHLKEGMEDWGDIENQPFKTNGNSDDNCQMDVKKCLFAAEHYNDRNYIDLYHFVSLLGNDKNIYKGYKEPWKDILEGIEGIGGVGGAVIANAHGENHKESHGMSIYFPRHETKQEGFNDCDGKASTDCPFDNPLPSRYEGPADDPAIYAEDETTEWGKVPYTNPPPHPWKETPHFLWRDEDIHWDEFLHRYYKPCADAGEDITVEVECGEKAKITLEGRGSSSTDDDGTIREYIWDYDLQTNSDSDDWDRDGVDEYNDDRDATGATPTHEFSPGVYVVTLTVWDDHHIKNEPKCNDFPNEHWKTDQDSVVITVIEKPCPDTEPPDTTIVTPPDGAEVDESVIEVIGTATDNVGIVEFGYTHEWSGGEESDSWSLDNLSSYQFNFDLEIYPGSNGITVYARDAAGNEGNDSVTVYYWPEEDTSPPITCEEVGQPSSEGGYQVTPGTPIWLNATDDMSGVNYIYYEVWSDEDGDDNVDTMKANITVHESSVEIYFGEYEIYFGIAEIHFYAVDNAGNIEEMKIGQHLVREG